MKNELERSIIDLSNSAKIIDELGKKYSPNDDRLEELTDIGMLMMCLPEYHQTDWLAVLDEFTLEVVHRYFLLMEVYISNAVCRGIFINNPLNIKNDVSRLERVEIAKNFMGVNLAKDDVGQLTVEVMNRLNASCELSQSEDKYIYAGLMFNYYYLFVKNSIDQMGWTNIRGKIVTHAFDHAKALMNQMKQMLDTKNGRTELVSNLDTFHRPAQ